MEKRINIISASSFALVCFLFFLPFINIECGSQKIFSVTGIELVTGFTYQIPSPEKGANISKESNMNYFALLALLASCIGCIGSLLDYYHKRIRRDSIALASVFTFIALLALQVQMNSRIKSEVKTILVRLNFEIGYWICLAIPIFLILFLILTKNQLDNKQS
jgi:hypothetical protein